MGVFGRATAPMNRAINADEEVVPRPRAGEQRPYNFELHIDSAIRKLCKPGRNTISVQ